MSQAAAGGLDRRRAEQLLHAARGASSVAGRIEIFSRILLGRPYRSSPLIGSAATPEVFTAAFDGFDCVTYIETVLALARATAIAGFFTWLRRIRYERGRVRWESRNHYMTRWIRNNVREGVLDVPRLGVSVLHRERVLDAVAGLPARRARIACTPKRAVPRLGASLMTADLMFFVSTRPHLDVFHAGILVRNCAALHLRHASRTRGCVVEEPLSDFLRANRMAGVIVVRPRELRGLRIATLGAAPNDRAGRLCSA